MVADLLVAALLLALFGVSGAIYSNDRGHNVLFVVSLILGIFGTFVLALSASVVSSDHRKQTFQRQCEAQGGTMLDHSKSYICIKKGFQRITVKIN